MIIKTYLLLLILVLTVGCASSGGKVTDFDIERNYRHGQYDVLVPQLEEKVRQSNSKDSLLWRLNLALAYQASGRYKDSNSLLIAIKDEIKWSDFLNLKEESLAFLLNEKYKKFNLAEYEQFLIQVYVAMNFALMNKWDNALVEMRAADLALYNLKQSNPNFATVDKAYLSYLSGVIYEANGKFDEAFIDYQRVYHHSPKMAYLGYDLFRTAFLSNRIELSKKYAKEYNISVNYQNYIKSRQFVNQGEIVVIFQNGMAPHKVESKRWANLPEYQPRLAGTEASEIILSYEPYGQTVLLMDFEKLALQLYEAQYKSLLAKDVARSVVKEAAAWTVGLSSGFMGVVAARTIAHSTTTADLRSWFLLPKELQIARIKVEPGKYRLQLNYNKHLGDIEYKDIKLKPQQFLMVPFKYGNSL